MKSIDLVPAPTGPFPVIEIDGSGKEKVIAKGDDLNSARYGLTQMAATWANSKMKTPKAPQRSVRFLDPLTVMLFYSDGKLRALLMVDPVPVKPGETHVADILVERKAAK